MAQGSSIARMCLFSVHNVIPSSFTPVSFWLHLAYIDTHSVSYTDTDTTVYNFKNATTDGDTDPILVVPVPKYPRDKAPLRDHERDRAWPSDQHLPLHRLWDKELLNFEDKTYPDLDDLSDFSKITEGSRFCDQISVSHVSCGSGTSPKRRLPRETVGLVIVKVSWVSEHWQEIKVLRIMLKGQFFKKVEETVRSLILTILRWRNMNFTPMIEIFENSWNEEHDKLICEKIQFRENCIRLNMSWRSKIWNEEIENMHQLSHNVSLNPKDYSCVKQVNGQIRLYEKE